MSDYSDFTSDEENSLFVEHFASITIEVYSMIEINNKNV